MTVKKNEKKLSLRIETLRDLTPEEMNKAQGGMPWYCWAYLIPSAGATTLAISACR